MSVIETSEDVVLLTPMVPESNPHNSLYEAWLPTVRWLRWIPSIDGASPPYPPGYKRMVLNAPLPEVVQDSISERESNPFDNPPGEGYFVLKKQNAYIAPKILSKRSRVIINGNQFLRSSGPTNPPGIVNYMSYYTNGSSADWWDYVPLNPSDGADAFISARNTAITNLYSSLSRRTKINGGVLLAELSESLGLLGKAVTQLCLIIHSVKKGDIKSAYKLISEYFGGRVENKLRTRESLNRKRKKNNEPPITKAEYASSSWLELQFGWLPIISDIYSIIEYIEDKMDKQAKSDHGPWFSFSGYGKVTYTGAFSPRNAVTFCNIYNTMPKGTQTYKVAYTATFKMESPLKQVLNEIGLINPASVAWEIVPFSFVIDWILPVGDYIESFTAHAGLELLHVHSSNKVSTSLQYPRPHRVGTLDGVDIGVELQTFTRVIEPISELPPFPFVTVSLDRVLQPWKLITSLALIKQVSGKR